MQAYVGYMGYCIHCMHGWGGSSLRYACRAWPPRGGQPGCGHTYSWLVGQPQQPWDGSERLAIIVGCLSLLAGGRDRASASGLLEACKTPVFHLGGY